MKFEWKRTLRTPSSERFIAIVGDAEAAAVDLHYLASGTVSGTVIVIRDRGLTENDVPALLKSLDEDQLPDVDLTRGTLVYTVVVGNVIGVFEAESDETPPPENSPSHRRPR